MFGPAWHCLTQFDVQADSVLQMVLDLGRYLDNHPIPDHEDIVNIIKEIVGTIVTSVNGKTGEVNLKLSDVTGTDSWPVWILTYAEYGEITDATMLDAYDNDGFRLLYVTAGSDPEKEPAFLMIPGRTFNPDGITRYIFTGGGGSGGGAVQSVNGKVGTVVLTAADVGALPDTYVPPAPPVTSVNTKTGEVVLSASDVGAPNTDEFNTLAGQVGSKYGPDNAPPYPVTSVNGKTGDISGIAESANINAGTRFYGADRIGSRAVAVENGVLYGITDEGNSVPHYSYVFPPPYPVTSANIEPSSFFYATGRPNERAVAVDNNGGVHGITSAGVGIQMYSPINPPPATARRYACGYSSTQISTPNSGLVDLTFNRVSGNIVIEGAKKFVLIGGIGNLIVLSLSLQINQSSAAYYVIRMHTTANEDIELGRGTLAPVEVTNIGIAMTTNYIYYNASTQRVSFHIEVGGYFNIGVRECSVMQI